MQNVRDNGWDELLEEVNNFCVKNDINIPNMEHNVQGLNCSRRFGHPITYERQFKVEIFYQVIDKVILEMDNRFNESNTELLSCIACLDPKNSFFNFDESKILRLAELYPHDFPEYDKPELKNQLNVWIIFVREKESFSKLGNIGDLAKEMVDVGIHNVFHLVYRIIVLVLVLLVATATVERVFSAMNIIKTDLRNKMNDEFLSDALVCYVEKDVFKSIDNETIMQHFQSMKIRKIDLPPLHFEEAEV
ncbi:hypothetical protein V2J09_004817 [Rumex salicifolius]